MGRRGAGKMAGTGNGALDRRAAGAPAASAPAKFPARPRRGNRLLLTVSGLVFLSWLVALAWLAFF